MSWCVGWPERFIFSSSLSVFVILLLTVWARKTQQRMWVAISGAFTFSGHHIWKTDQSESVWVLCTRSDSKPINCILSQQLYRSLPCWFLLHISITASVNHSNRPYPPLQKQESKCSPNIITARVKLRFSLAFPKYSEQNILKRCRH